MGRSQIITELKSKVPNCMCSIILASVNKNCKAKVYIFWGYNDVHKLHFKQLEGSRHIHNVSPDSGRGGDGGRGGISIIHYAYFFDMGHCTHILLTYFKKV